MVPMFAFTRVVSKSVLKGIPFIPKQVESSILRPQKSLDLAYKRLKPTRR